MNWQDLGVGLALLLVFEGILPFISPILLKKTYATITQMADHSLRLMGLCSMLLGTFLLYWVR